MAQGLEQMHFFVYGMAMITTNYHTHTYRCKHAEGDIADFAEAAGAEGFTRLGFSEHMPLADDRWSFAHMEAHQMDDYVTRIREYTGEVQLYAGGECEYVKTDHAYYKEKLLGEYGLDYLLGAPHWIPCRGEWVGYTHLKKPSDLIFFSKYCIELARSGLFSCIAHPDVFMVGYGTWDANARSCARDILQAARECDIPLEFNANGLRKYGITELSGLSAAGYPNLDFWQEASQTEVKVVIGSDAHAPSLLSDSLDICEQAVSMLGLQLVDPIAA
jgi:histidinol-phosphatase (PHP family)